MEPNAITDRLWGTHDACIPYIYMYGVRKFDWARALAVNAARRADSRGSSNYDEGEEEEDQEYNEEEEEEEGYGDEF